MANTHVNIDELAAELPNGLHDALLRSYSEDPARQRAEFLIDVWLGDLHSAVPAERERRRVARLELLGLAYLVVDDGDPRFPITNGVPVQIDCCAADENPQLTGQVPERGFAGRFFVTEWNAFIHFAACDVLLTWVGAN